MQNKKYTLCLNCGKAQVRTDIEDIIEKNYVQLEKTQIICPGCIGRRHVATTNIKELVNALDSKKDMTDLDRRVLYLARKW